MSGIADTADETEARSKHFILYICRPQMHAPHQSIRLRWSHKSTTCDIIFCGRVNTRLAITHSRRIFRGFIPRLISFTLLFSSIFIDFLSSFITKRWENNPASPARTPTTFCARFPPRRNGTRPSRSTSDAPGRMFPSSPPAYRRHDLS